MVFKSFSKHSVYRVADPNPHQKKLMVKSWNLTKLKIRRVKVVLSRASHNAIKNLFSRRYGLKI